MRVHEESLEITGFFSRRLVTPVRVIASGVAALLLLAAAPIYARAHCDVHHRRQQRIDATQLRVAFSLMASTAGDLKKRAKEAKNCRLDPAVKAGERWNASRSYSQEAT